MVPVRGKPFLEHQLELVRGFGFTDVLILAGYLGEQIEDYFGDGSSLSMSLDYSFEETPMGTGGGLKMAESKLEGSFILLNGDTLLPIDYAKMAALFGELGKKAFIVAYDNSEKIVQNNLELSATGAVLAYDKRESHGKTHLDAGAIALDRSVLDMIEPGRVCSLEEEIFMRLIEMGEFAAFTTVQRFYDMGSHEGLRKIEKVLS